MAVVAAKLDPGSEQRTKVRQAEAKISKLEETANVISADDPKTGVKFADMAGTEHYEDYANVLDKKAEASEALFNLEPTEENRKAWKQAEGAAKGTRQHHISEKKRIAKENAEFNAQESLALEQERVGKSKIGRQLMENAPQSPRKKGETIKYDNI